MKLSVIIVNYNVKAYLEQCLRAVFEALKEVDGEVYVVDNLSMDGSVEMVRKHFPQVKLIANTENVGFSKANNQAIRASDAEYVVLLNPDTVVGEDVFRKVIDFMDAHPGSGGLGVKMIDGKGRFLPESKRGLPTPAVAFFKIIGLARLFPRSKVFGRYHLGHLPENDVVPIEILSGACMFLRKATLDKVGLLDENFFMYGEDIDLSYRITLGGYENWYFPDARIIHYKGESTKKSSVNYVFVFYNAMAIFARKHFARRGPQLFSLLIRGSIYLSAAGAITSRFLRGALLPMMDTAFLVGGMFLLHRYLPLPSNTALGLVMITVLLVMAVCGAYDKPMRFQSLLKGLLGLSLIAVVLALVEGSWIPLIGMVLLTIGLSFSLSRIVLFLVGMKGQWLRTSDRKRVLAIGSAEETQQALGLLWQTHFGLAREISMKVDGIDDPQGGEWVARAIKEHRIDEVLFCAEDLRWQRIIEMMEELADSGAMFKIAQPASRYIIGPSTTESLNDLLILQRYSVGSSAARRTKRMLDIGLATLFIAILPVSVWMVDRKAGFMRNIVRVLDGRNSWVGYFHQDRATVDRINRRLPELRPGILTLTPDAEPKPHPVIMQRMDLEYAKDYRVWTDLKCVLSDFRSLGMSAPFPKIEG